MRCRNFLLLTLLSVGAGLTGCSTSQEAVLPQPDTNVEQVWQETMQGEASEVRRGARLKGP
ncbi:hypothetical protein VII00023_09731 [Vibrio ichthyoenteri ATCC 700023]|uniref:Uncharacterized protein n=1 Tax=Vibrio ichthyoenteri ATCC 700023 TaxID=870968 RepID=F9S1P9_9VIBR|nr:hypothetical protein [Vibrio ichthyoenteri]EGU41510.1 hypothetical protein VII00023_09731 [Vibrio ichthyoenteri ATCC 700023]